MRILITYIEAGHGHIVAAEAIADALRKIGDEEMRILITYIEAGHGHIVAAEAIADALRKIGDEEIEIVEKYVLRDSGDEALRKFERFLIGQVRGYSRFPWLGALQMAAMHIFGAKNTLKLLHSTVFRRETEALVREYEALRPQVIVATHYFTALCAVEYRCRCDGECRVVLYCPDNSVHGWWDTRADRLYTNNPTATADALRLGFPRERVTEVFYPVRASVLAARADRGRFGIEANAFAVVVADGIYARARAGRVVRSLLRSKRELTVCLLAGKNSKLKEKFDKKIGTLPKNITLKTFGFLPDAPALYGACDLFITKAGPNAVLDSIMMGTPVIIDYCATPIERRTKEIFIDGAGCGYYIKSARRIRKCVEALMDEPRRLGQIRKNLEAFDKRKSGAARIAEDLQAQKSENKNNDRRH